MADEPRRISLILPALNEELGIGGVLDSVPKEELEAMGFSLEILVVDGESFDRTREIARSKGARVIVEPRKGYGRAYRTGFERAQGEILVTADADGSYPVDRIHELVAILERHDLDFVTVNRFAHLHPGSMSLLHRVGNRLLSALMRAMFAVPVRDSQSGMWAFRRSILPQLVLTSDGMSFSEEIKIEAFRRLGPRAREVPLEYRPRVGDRKLMSLRDGWENLLFLVRKRFGLVDPVG